MNKKISQYSLRIVNITTIVLFALFIYGVMITHLLLPDREYSSSERRKLTIFSDIKPASILNFNLSQDAEKWLLDQFPLRDNWRRLSAFTSINLFRMHDYQSVFEYNNRLFKQEFPLKEKSVIAAANMINDFTQNELAGLNIWYSIIPDRNAYLPENDLYLRMDYEKLNNIMRHNTSSSEIVISDLLDLTDYYKTDLHWKSAEISDVAARLAETMGQTKLSNQDSNNYISHSLKPFYGAWSGQYLLSDLSDELVWISNDRIKKARAWYHYDGKYGHIYDTQALANPDAYDLFLGGAQPLITLSYQTSFEQTASNTSQPEDSHTTANSDKTLYLFRDSFGSSVAPLLLDYYDEIILIDLRYVSAENIDSLIDFKQGADVLFLYSASIQNNSEMLIR